MKTAPPAPRKSQPRSESTVVKTWVKPTSTYQSQTVYRGTAWPAPARMMNPKRSQRPTRGGRRPFATASLHPPAHDEGWVASPAKPADGQCDSARFRESRRKDIPPG